MQLTIGHEEEDVRSQGQLKILDIFKILKVLLKAFLFHILGPQDNNFVFGLCQC